jgi:uncharacterized protein
MNQPAKAQEPSMEEILASIRRIIADDDASKPAKPPEPPKPTASATVSPAPVSSAPQQPAAMSQDDIDAMLAGFDAPAAEPPPPLPAAPPPESLEPNAGQELHARHVEPEPPTEPDILDLTDAMAAAPEPESAPAPVFRTIGSEPDVVFSDFEEPAREAPPEELPAPANGASPEPPRDYEAPHEYESPREYEIPREYEAPRSHAPVEEPVLMSSGARAAVDAAFNSLAHTVLVQNARTLEDLVKEMLRPMLKSWLDDNLPGLVERLVRAEIERVSRGRP